MNRRLSLAGISLALLAVVAMVRPAHAGTATNNLAVSANVLGSCTIDPASLSFVNYDPSAAVPLDSSGTITVRCTQGSSYWIGLGDGLNFSGSRRMAGGVTEFLAYGLYRDAGYTQAWDNTDGGLPNSTATTAAAGFSAYTHTVYGRIPVGQNVSTGAYADTVAMTVNF
jgi:spore coat protein U-like protein